jgi:hypothetical protein
MMKVSEALLTVVESSYDQHYYFAGADQGGSAMVVDARRAAAVALMLAQPAHLERKAIIARVGKYYPDVVKDIGSISLRAMVNASFGGSHRTSVPGDAFDMNDVLGELLAQSGDTRKGSGKKARKGRMRGKH